MTHHNPEKTAADLKSRIRDVRLAEPMSRHTTFRVGGPADVMVLPTGNQQVAFVLRYAREEDISLTLVGAGSNLVVRDGGIRGIVLKLASNFARIQRRGTGIWAQSGARLRRVCDVAAASSLSGLVFACGIPGTLGGGLVMNAGAYDGCLADVVTRVTTVTHSGQLIERTNEEMGFGYRTSILRGSDAIALSAQMHLKRGDRDEILAQQKAILEDRARKQPLHFANAGSIFKRPPGDYAGRLIEAAGLKGETIGQARVSPLHANFIINLGGATASDIVRLIDHVRQRVYETSGVMLEREVIVLGED